MKIGDKVKVITNFKNGNGKLNWIGIVKGINYVANSSSIYSVYFPNKYWDSYNLTHYKGHKGFKGIYTNQCRYEVENETEGHWNFLEEELTLTNNQLELF